MRAVQEIEWIGISGCSAALRDDMELCSSTDAKVLITADSGVDRAFIARTIHDRRTFRMFTAQSRVGCSSTRRVPGSGEATRSRPSGRARMCMQADVWALSNSVRLPEIR